MCFLFIIAQNICTFQVAQRIVNTNVAQKHKKGMQKKLCIPFSAILPFFLDLQGFLL